MIRPILAAAMLLASAPATVQSAQETLDARYDRALAAGYKALFLCSAIANAERNGATRTLRSVIEWELTGIQAPLDGIVAELHYSVVRQETYDRTLSHVTVQWEDGQHPRMAYHRIDAGCSLAPVGFDPGGIARGPYTMLAPERSEASVTNPVSLPVLSRGFDGTYGEGTRSTAFVVLHDGRTVGEAYETRFSSAPPQRTWSVAKSIASTLVGAAVHRGETDVSSPAPIEEWQANGDPRQRITLDHLLRMASGRYSDTPGNRTDPLYWGGSTVDETALHWPLIHEPGTVYRYANNDTLAAIEAISPAFEEHPPAEFFARLGMNHTVAETD